MNRLPDTKKGSILVWTAIVLAVLIAFVGLATDIPYLYVAKQQAQTAADAGAIAGAYGLLGLHPDSSCETVLCQAGADARTVAAETPIIGESLTTPEIDVFACNNTEAAAGGDCPATGAGPYDRVTAVTYRDVGHENHPMPLFILPILQLFGLGPATADSSGWNAANLSASATARIFTTCSGDCFKPWSITDRWVDVNHNEKFDPATDLYDPVTTGYQWPADTGLQVTLKSGGNNITPSFYYAVNFPPQNRGTPEVGADPYRENIAACGDQSFVAVGDVLRKENGNMTGPTRQGVEALIALDPTAFWDTACNCINSPKGAGSPRLIRIGFFDPRVPVEPGGGSVTVVKIGGFFLEGVESNGDVTGRFTQVAAWGGPPDPACSGLQTVQLVK